MVPRNPEAVLQITRFQKLFYCSISFLKRFKTLLLVSENKKLILILDIESTSLIKQVVSTNYTGYQLVITVIKDNLIFFNFPIWNIHNSCDIKILGNCQPSIFLFLTWNHGSPTLSCIHLANTLSGKRLMALKDIRCRCSGPNCRSTWSLCSFWGCIQAPCTTCWRLWSKYCRGFDETNNVSTLCSGISKIGDDCKE